MANKTKTIKNASDKELDDLIYRLRRESELQRVIADIQRMSNPYGRLNYDAPNISTEEPIENLYHFGIPGMKWGRRKGSSRSSSKSKINDSEDYTKRKTLSRKKVKQLSNAELKTLNERLQLEKQYKDLSKSTKESGKKVAGDILKTAGKNTASTVVSAAALYAAKKAIQANFGDEVYKGLFPKSK